MYPLDDATINQLFVTLLWSSYDAEGVAPLDSLGYQRDDIAAADQSGVIADFRRFCERHDTDVRAYMAATGRTLDDVAHDYILTRNGHGTGFWDRGAGEVGDALTAAVDKLAEINLEKGDDGALHVF